MTRTPADIREAQKVATLAPGEASYRAYREAQAREFADEPADLPGTLRMLEEWAPDALPANELGQVPFARALMDAAAGAIRKHLAAQSVTVTVAPQNAMPISEDDEGPTCGICAASIQIGDLCANETEMGMVHAECLDGSPVVDDAGEEINAPLHTYRWEGDR